MNSPHELLVLFFWIALACVVAWGACKLVKWAKLPEPVEIVALVLLCVVVIYMMARAFGVGL